MTNHRPTRSRPPTKPSMHSSMHSADTDKLMGEKKNSSPQQTVSQRATAKVGDGKFPNKYFVTVSNSFYDTPTKNDDGSTSLDWANNDAKAKTIKEFSNYAEAVDFAENQYGKPFKDNEGKTQLASSVFVEDRLSGQVYEHTINTPPNSDIEFSRETELKNKKKSTSDDLKNNYGQGKTNISKFKVYDLENPEAVGMTAHQQRAMWQKIVDNGQAWTLQGWYGRTAQGLIDDGVIKPHKRKQVQTSED